VHRQAVHAVPDPGIRVGDALGPQTLVDRPPGLALVLIAGTLPGVITGSVIRVELLPGAHVFDLVVAAVLVPLGGWLALTRPTRIQQRLPDTLIRRMMGVLVVAIGVRYLWSGLGGRPVEFAW
jgi:small neutral amino acid transporter SnatA (MarC family)